MSFNELKYMTNRKKYSKFDITPSINPPQTANAVGLIFWSLVDTGCDMETAMYYILCVIQYGGHN